MTTDQFLSELPVYPNREQINEASDYAQDKAYEYLISIDPDATLTVEDGSTYVQSAVLEEDDEQLLNVQSVFDEEFAEKILSLQPKSVLNKTLFDSIVWDNSGFAQESGETNEEYNLRDFDAYPEGWDCVFNTEYFMLSEEERKERREILREALN